VKRGPAKKPARRALESEHAEADALWHRLDAQARERITTIANVEEAILALGGPFAVQMWLGEDPRQVASWIKDGGSFPRSYHLQVYIALTGLGYRRISPQGVRAAQLGRTPHAEPAASGSCRGGDLSGIGCRCA